MTFSLRRKHLISAVVVLCAFSSATYGQSFITIQPPDNSAKPPTETPKFFPAVSGTQPAAVPRRTIGPASDPKPAANSNFEVFPVAAQQKILPIAAQQDMPFKQHPVREEEPASMMSRTTLPGPQLLFLRQSEERLFERMRKEMKKQGNELFYLPEETPVSKISFTQLPSPRMDPITNEPFARHQTLVEPSYVLHGRLYFEQPNFERIGWNLGIVQTGVELGVFYYDLAMLPYHCFSDLHPHIESSAGKCLPGDMAPLLLPIERFSVTGAIGEVAVIIGGVYMIPFPWVR